MGLPAPAAEVGKALRGCGGRARTALALLGCLLGACRPTDGRPDGARPGSPPPTVSAATAASSEAAGGGSSPSASPPRALGTPSTALRLSLVDHASFRKLDEGEGDLAEDLATTQRRMAAAQALGASRYVLFTGDLESLLTYDLPVPGLGALGPKAFPPGDPRREQAARSQAALAAVIAEGRRLGLEVWVHTNQFSYPEPVFALARPAIADEAGHICVDRPVTWALYRAKLTELFDALPGLSGLQLTADEAEQSLFGCAPGGSQGEGGRIGAADGSTLARVNRLVAETAQVAAERGLAVEARTWGRLYRLEEEADPRRMTEGLPANTDLSLKVTDGDFHLFSPPSPLLAHVDARVTLELDAWGEHLGFNHFPCWQGPVWAPMLRPALARGVRRLALRIAWDQQANDLFERPWGNLLNLDYARALADDPGLEPDSFLQAWVAARYRPPAREAAMALYRRSTALQAVWLAEDEVELTDHSRLFRPYGGGDRFERVRDRLDRLQAEGAFLDAADFAARRATVAAACTEAQDLVAALARSGGAPEAWTAELARGARAQCRVAEGVTDQLELLHLRRREAAGEEAPGLADLAARIRAWTAAWQAEDPASFELLEGGAAAALLEGEG